MTCLKNHNWTIEKDLKISNENKTSVSALGHMPLIMKKTWRNLSFNLQSILNTESE